MALTTFEIAIGGITSIPTTAGLVFLAYKTWGEKRLDTSKLQPKKTAFNSSKKAVTKSEKTTKAASQSSQDKPSANQQAQSTNPIQTAAKAAPGATSKSNAKKAESPQ